MTKQYTVVTDKEHSTAAGEATKIELSHDSRWQEMMRQIRK